MSDWYAVYTHAQSEVKAALNLRQQGFLTYLPQYLRLRRHARRRDWVAAPLFPRYLFVSLDLDRDPWRAVHSTIGIHHLLCHGEQPVKVPDAILRDIRGREDTRGKVVLNKVHPLKAGENVQILSGAFADQTGIFEAETDEDRVKVLITLLGRQLSVEVPTQVVRALA